MSREPPSTAAPVWMPCTCLCSHLPGKPWRSACRARESESASIQAQRLLVARQELAHYTAYDYVVINDQLDDAVETHAGDYSCRAPSHQAGWYGAHCSAPHAATDERVSDVAEHNRAGGSRGRAAHLGGSRCVTCPATRRSAGAGGLEHQTEMFIPALTFQTLTGGEVVPADAMYGTMVGGHYPPPQRLGRVGGGHGGGASHAGVAGEDWRLAVRMKRWYVPCCCIAAPPCWPTLARPLCISMPWCSTISNVCTPPACICMTPAFPTRQGLPMNWAGPSRPRR